eukprot:483283-Prorocentrum_minimum.AAC.1
MDMNFLDICDSSQRCKSTQQDSVREREDRRDAPARYSLESERSDTSSESYDEISLRSLSPSGSFRERWYAGERCRLSIDSTQSYNREREPRLSVSTDSSSVRGGSRAESFSGAGCSNRGATGAGVALPEETQKGGETQKASQQHTFQMTAQGWIEVREIAPLSLSW